MNEEIFPIEDPEAEFRDLISKLRELPCETPAPGFFEQQCAAVEEVLEFEAYEDLVFALKEISPQDPGDLFFKRQQRAIEKQLDVTKPKLSRPRVWQGVFAAAACLVLTWGVLQFKGYRPVESPKIAENGASRPEAATANINGARPKIDLDFEELDPQALKQLAKNLERSVLRQAADPWIDPEDEQDLDSLNPQQMEQLIRKMEAKLQT